MSESPVEIRFTDAAIEDLRRLGPDAVPRVLKKLVILETDPKAGHPLGGELTGFRKLAAGRHTWRVVYRITEDTVEICEIWAIGMRRDSAIYAEARRRALDVGPPDLRYVQLADVVERLGRIATGVEIDKPADREPVPDWLAERLIHTAGLRPEEVAALDARQAFERWNTVLTSP